MNVSWKVLGDDSCVASVSLLRQLHGHIQPNNPRTVTLLVPLVTASPAENVSYPRITMLSRAIVAFSLSRVSSSGMEGETWTAALIRDYKQTLLNHTTRSRTGI